MAVSAAGTVSTRYGPGPVERETVQGAFGHRHGLAVTGRAGLGKCVFAGGELLPGTCASGCGEGLYDAGWVPAGFVAGTTEKMTAGGKCAGAVAGEKGTAGEDWDEVVRGRGRRQT